MTLSRSFKQLKREVRDDTTPHISTKHPYANANKYNVNFTPEKSTKAQRGSRGIALLFL
jgi:hypothetical protein